MDTHRAAFIAEAEDGITALNNALLALEADPTDQAAVDDVFRVAHTLKGNAAAMGYDDVSSLGHALEDLLDAVRSGEKAVTPALMDLLFEGTDVVESMIAEIRETGEPTTDPSPIESRLRKAEASEDTQQPTPDDSPAAETPQRSLATDFEDPARVTVTTAETEMPGVDAAFILQALASSFDEFVTDPPASALEAGEFDGAFDVAVEATPTEQLIETLEAVGQVAAVEPMSEAEPADEADEQDAGDAGASTGATSEQDEITSIRVGVDQVDELYGLVEQLVTSRIKLHRELEAIGAEADAVDELDKLTASLQDTAMNMRLIPFSQVADAFPRLVRDIARDLDKQVDFTVEGADVELDRTILTEMRDPLVHVLRNAVDHGIESPSARESAGKSAAGSVRLSAERERDHVIIEVADDGAGLDADRLREKAVTEDVISRETAESMTDSEVYDLVFHPGLSTAAAVTDVSGRGVGMDVVRTTARELDGSVSVDSEPGAGTTVRFRLPVTVAIVTVMFVAVDGTEYGIPIKSIAEVSRAAGVETVHGDEVVRHENELYPVIRLADRLDTSANAEPASAVDTTEAAADGGTTQADDGMLVRIREDTRRVALHCDAVVNQEEVVVKPLDGPLSGTPGLSGTAVLGDGDVVGVLDVVSL